MYTDAHKVTHTEDHLKSSEALSDIVIGMSDGLTVPFALAAGLSGALAHADNWKSLLLTAGIAEVVAGCIAMGLGGYLAGRTEVDHYNSELKREYDEVERLPDVERAEVKEFFAHLGLSEDVQNKAVDELTKDKKRWVDFMMKYELGMDQPDPKRAAKSAFNIGLAYVVGGMVPLSPYYFAASAKQGLMISASVTLLFLFIFGFFKSKMTGVNPVFGGVKVMLIGACAAGAAFFVARLFG